MTTQREQSEDGVLEIHADETSRRALLLADVPDDELEEYVEDITAKKKKKYLPALQSVLCNYKQSTRFLYSIIKDGHQPEEIDHRDNVSDFVLALSNFQETVQLLRGPIQVGTTSAKIAELDLGNSGGSREPAIIQWKSGNVVTKAEKDERSKLLKAIEAMNDTNGMRYRPADVARNKGRIGNWCKVDIVSFIRQASSRSTMEKANKLADEIDETLGQKKFFGQRREYCFRNKGNRYGKRGSATNSFVNWLQEAGVEWKRKSSAPSTTSTSSTARKRSRRISTESEQSATEERQIRCRRSEELSPGPCRKVVTYPEEDKDEARHSTLTNELQELRAEIQQEHASRVEAEKRLGNQFESMAKNLETMFQGLSGGLHNLNGIVQAVRTHTHVTYELLVATKQAQDRLAQRTPTATPQPEPMPPHTEPTGSRINDILSNVVITEVLPHVDVELYEEAPLRPNAGSHMEN